MGILDLRDVRRALWRDRGYSAAVLLTLGLTIGASTAVFSIVNGVLLAPRPYPHADRLVVIEEGTERGQYPWVPVNAGHFLRWREGLQSFDRLVEAAPRTATLTGAGESVVLTVADVAG